MLPHVELNRTFWRLRDTEEHDAETFKVYAAFGLEGEDWAKLLERSRVVILAEAGTGKTQELQEAAVKLRRDNKAAFFCRIEELAVPPLARSLGEDKARELYDWLASDGAGWFFLDSVDEARLKDSTYFERALRTLAEALGREALRARIFISARVSDWRATADLTLLKTILPPPKAEKRADEDAPESSSTPEDDVHVVELAPLSTDQMRKFAEAQGVKDSTSFMAAIERAGASIFAERPQDLLELVSYWIEHGVIGSHAEMIQFNIEKKLLEPNPDRDQTRPLAKAKALGGARALAAALTFVRKSSIILPDRPIDPARAAQAIDAKSVLPTWDPRDVQTLLDRALFDEATYGRVRFHHQSVREFLIARWLHYLLESGKRRRAIEGLLFATRYGVSVVVPSMKPVTAWLALWDDRVRDRTIAIAPEVLLEHGDPSRLPVDSRSRLLRTVADLNQGRTNTDVSFDLASIRRLADPQLAMTVLELLDRHRANRDLRQLLLGMIWQGQIAECAKSALSFALDSSMDPYTRVLGIRAVVAAGSENLKRCLADAMLANAGEWSNREIGEGVAALYPDNLTLGELVEILENAKSPKEYSVDPLDQALEGIIDRDLPKPQQEALLVALIRLLEREPHIERRNCGISARYAWLLEHAVKLAKQIIMTSDSDKVDFPASALRTIELEAQGQHYIEGYHRRYHGFDHLINKMPNLRHILFWRAVKKQRKVRSGENGFFTEWWQIDFVGRELVSPRLDDFDAFVEDISNRDNMDDRLVALTAAYSAWRDAGRPRKGRERMWRAIKGERELETKLRALLHPAPTSDGDRRWRRRERDYASRLAKRRQQEEQAHTDLVRRLTARINEIRTVKKDTLDHVFPDLYRLARRISKLAENKLGKANSRWGNDRWDLLEADLGKDIAEGTRDGLMRYWRLYKPQLLSESDGKGRTNGVLAGLTGLAIEVRERPNWAHRLLAEEACTAARYAVHEMNGLPDWALDLMKVHPEAFDSAVIPELTWELSLAADKPEPHHVVSTLRYGSQSIRERYAPGLQRLLEEHEPAHFSTLESALSVLLQWDGLDVSRFAALARRRCDASQDDGRRLTWIVAWMCVDADGALGTLRAWLEDAKDVMEADRRMIAFCNAMMNHNELRFGDCWRDFERIEVLRELVPLIYRHVRIEDDNVHEGAYSPDARDDAETTRSYLLSRVAQRSGREAFDTLIAFSQELPNKWSQDRMIVLARRRAGEDAELTIWTVSDLLSFADEGERNPRSARDLFELTQTRLDDLKLDLEEGDASEAAILRGVDQETELRNWFAKRLREAARGRYSGLPEVELADATRPDLYIHAPAIDATVPIELKIADGWSYSQLVERLRNQLVGQYLRDTRSRFGVFLLVWRGLEGWRHPETGKRLRFDALVEQLQAESKIIQQRRYDLEAIAVVGIDLTRRHVRPGDVGASKPTVRVRKAPRP